MADKLRTMWHRYFAYLLQQLLTPVGLTVYAESQVSSTPAKIDVIIIKSNLRHWTPEQLELLPDGIRDSQATHILLELKYTESFNEEAALQILCYKSTYQEAQQLGKTEVQGFLVISKTPQSATLRKYGYQASSRAGVYHSDNVLLTNLPMLVLNELGNEPYNVYFKLFASRLAVKEEAVKTLNEKEHWQRLTRNLQSFLRGLLEHWFVMKGDDTMLELTPEQMVEAGRVFREFILPGMSVQERLADVSEDELSKIPLIHHIEEKGIEEGERKATLKALNKILTIRFNIGLGKFDKQFAELDLKSLEQLNEVALKVNTLVDFEKALTDMPRKKKTKLDKNETSA